jgi:hypothetical protein
MLLLLGLSLAFSAGTGTGAGRPPPTFVPIADFVPERFSFTARVSGLSPPPADEKKVRTYMEWGWGQKAGETVGYALPAQPSNFTRNKTGAYWARSYPNTYGLRPQYFLGRHGGEDSFLVTHLYFCHIGAEPSRNLTLRGDNQTTDVELNITLPGGETEQLHLAGTLEWGGLEGSCDGLGLLVGKRAATGKYFVETFRQHNAARYWPAFSSLPPTQTAPEHFPIMDGFRTGDNDLGATEDALAAANRLGLHGLMSDAPAWLEQRVLGYQLTAAGGEVALLEYLPGRPSRESDNLTQWAAQTARPLLAAGYLPDQVKVSPIHDEPGLAIPAALPPVGNASWPAVTKRWIAFLQANGLTPTQLGAAAWPDVLPAVAAGAAAGASLADRQLYYWSLRFVSHDSSWYLASATKALEAELVEGAPIYVNWNNMAAHWYYPSVTGTGQLNHDWFEFARLRGSTMLWTGEYGTVFLQCFH